MNLARLKAAGFRKIGHWEGRNSNELKLDSDVPKEPGVYLIFENEDVRYVGSAQAGLHKRFLKYRNYRNKGVVAVRLRGEILEALRRGSEVTVFVVTPPINVAPWQELPIDGIAGLEEGLIRQLQPKWNRRSRSSIDEEQETLIHGSD